MFRSAKVLKAALVISVMVLAVAALWAVAHCGYTAAEIALLTDPTAFTSNAIDRHPAIVRMIMTNRRKVAGR